MAALTDRVEKLLVDGLTGVQAYTTPSAQYLALFTADPGDAGDVSNELPDANAYARVDLAGKFGNSTDGSSSNTDIIKFAMATGDWGTITHVGIMESGTHGANDMVLHIALDNPIVINNGDTFEIAAGNLTISVD